VKRFLKDDIERDYTLK